MLHLPVLRWGEPYTSLEVDEVAHYGHVLRLATLGGADPGQVARAALAPLGIAVGRYHESRVTVEDAFVSVVRQEQRDRGGAAAEADAVAEGRD